jgi:hypothetical protein
MQPYLHLELFHHDFSDTPLFFGRSEAAERNAAHSPMESLESLYSTWLMLFDHGEHAMSHLVSVFPKWLSTLID